MAKLMFVLAACWAVIAASELFHAMWLLWLGLILFLGVVIGGVIRLNTGDRLKK